MKNPHEVSDRKHFFVFYIMQGFILCLLILFWYRFAWGESDNQCLGYYGITSPKWDCDASMEVFNGVSTIRMSTVWNTFGTDTTCLKRFLQDKRPKILEIHLINEVCQRNNHCGSYEFLSGMDFSTWQSRLNQADPELLSAYAAYAKPVADLLDGTWGSLTCYISPVLETKLANPGAKVLLDKTRELFPRCKTVWNPLNLHDGVVSDVQEGHGANPPVHPACIVNLDGQDIAFEGRHALQNHLTEGEIPGFLSRYTGCEMSCLWGAPFNGNDSGATGFIDPRKRSSFPDRNYFQRYVRYMKPGVALKNAPMLTAAEQSLPVEGCVNWFNPVDGKDNFVWKEGDNNRKAVWLSPARFQKVFRHVDVLSTPSKVIASFKFRHMFTEHGKPYRMIYDAQKPLSWFPYNVVLRADSNCWRLPNPKGRID